MILLMSLSFCTMALFALAMPKHRQHMFLWQCPVLLTVLFRPAAWLLCAVTCYLAIFTYGWTIGLVTFVAVLTAGLIPLILLLSYHPKMIVVLMVMLPALNLIKMV